MPRSKVVTALPTALREELERKWRSGKYSLDELIAEVKAIGADVSRTGLHRHLQASEEYQKGLEAHREAQKAASQWLEKVGEDPNGDVAHLVAELVKTIASRQAAVMLNSGEIFNPMDLSLLARTVKDLFAADKSSIERELRIRQLERERIAKEVGAKVTQVKEEGGLSDDVAERIMAALTGTEVKKK
jgi:hypothetical protein